MQLALGWASLSSSPPTEFLSDRELRSEDTSRGSGFLQLKQTHATVTSTTTVVIISNHQEETKVVLLGTGDLGHYHSIIIQ